MSNAGYTGLFPISVFSASLFIAGVPDFRIVLEVLEVFDFCQHPWFTVQLPLMVAS